MKEQDFLIVKNSDLGWMMGCGRTGISHKQNNKPYQDAYLIKSGSDSEYPYIFAAVADGHGDARHDLSHYGSKIAVESAMEVLLSLWANFGLRSSSSEFIGAFKQDFPRLVGREWREKVEKHGKELSEYNGIEPRKLYSRYGTTLLAAFVIKDSILLANLGDGDAIAIEENGKVTPLFEKNPNFVGGTTYSLSSNDADKLWQTAVLEKGKKSILLSTDGLSNAFEDEDQFYLFSKSLLSRIDEYGLEKVAEAMPTWLDGYSENGSGDDITLVLIGI